MNQSSLHTDLARGVAARPNLRLALCGLFLMFGPSSFTLVTAIVASGAIRAFPESAFAMHIWRFGITVVLSRSAAYGYTALACLGPPVIVFSIWRAWLESQRNRFTCRLSLKTGAPARREQTIPEYLQVG